MTGAASATGWRDLLPADWRDARLVARLDLGDGPTPVLVEGGVARDVSRIAPTVSHLLADGAPPPGAGTPIAPLDTLPTAALLAPVDLQCIKAAGVTFAVSALERVIEERARGDAGRSAAIRAGLEKALGGDLRSVEPGSPAADDLKARLIADGLWSQYLEVAIGHHAEIFTKAPVLAAVGWGAQVGVRSDSGWNNPEPEIVVVADAHGRAVGATLGNDVNLRDFEGRSALLLGEAKDNNASCAIGPLIRLFDDGYGMDDLCAADLTMTIEGTDGFRLTGTSTMREISRHPEAMLRQATAEHQYPDGFVLFCGTLFAPTQDRDQPGRGFTHHVGDTVTIAEARLGTLRNTVATSRDAPPWRTGIAALFRNLAARGLVTA